MNIFLVAFGGFFGSILRLYLSEKTQKRLIGTWTANITGSLLLALVFYLYQDGNLSEMLWIFLGIGFCGAYTTFSTFGNETLELIVDKKYFAATRYVGTTLIVPFILVFVVWFIIN